MRIPQLSIVADDDMIMILYGGKRGIGTAGNRPFNWVYNQRLDADGLKDHARWSGATFSAAAPPRIAVLTLLSTAILQHIRFIGSQSEFIYMKVHIIKFESTDING